MATEKDEILTRCESARRMLDEGTYSDKRLTALLTWVRLGALERSSLLGERGDGHWHDLVEATMALSMGFHYLREGKSNGEPTSALKEKIADFLHAVDAAAGHED